MKNVLTLTWPMTKQNKGRWNMVNDLANDQTKWRNAIRPVMHHMDLQPLWVEQGEETTSKWISTKC